jgi:hypothetical protein
MAAGARALKERKLREYAEKRELYFTALSDENTYEDEDSPPLTPPSSPLLIPSSMPPTPQELHELLALIANEETSAQEVGPNTSGMGPSSVDAPGAD